ncbi:hypothetical protein AGR4A_Cc190281 [Agrobacterium tumefaciens str. B6]|uniref:Uncharacterized protein n=1 Tax=Agrobacterium tumefaciens str. B6 TaxID=1183423 RepID=A0A822UZZ7_AGRTU|nr:hypothetical protein AGR4A_Cc190281 [Agrobacterium tumefaciens str. B6]
MAKNMPVPNTRILSGKTTIGNQSTQSQSIICIFPGCYLTLSVVRSATSKLLLQQLHMRGLFDAAPPLRFICGCRIRRARQSKNLLSLAKTVPAPRSKFLSFLLGASW